MYHFVSSFRVGYGLFNVRFNEVADLGLTVADRLALSSSHTAFGIGGFVMERLSIDAGFTLGLTDTYPDVDPDKNDLIDSMDGGKQMTFKVGAGFWFL